MTSHDNLHVTVGDIGVFVYFRAPDGSEAGLDIINLAEESGPIFGRILFSWCRDRITEQPAKALSPDLRAELLARTDPASVGNSGLEQATKDFGHRVPISHDWLDEQELLAEGAAAVCLSGDQFLDLLAVARNGLRPKAAT
jgi:hypothetical protein